MNIYLAQFRVEETPTKESDKPVTKVLTIVAKGNEDQMREDPTTRIRLYRDFYSSESKRNKAMLENRLKIVKVKKLHKIGTVNN